jgi:hypothetical protein
MKLNPNDPTAVYHLILALRRNGDTGEVSALVKRLASLRTESAGQTASEKSLIERAPATRP